MERSMFSLDFFRLASAIGGTVGLIEEGRDESEMKAEGKRRKMLFSSPLF